MIENHTVKNEELLCRVADGDIEARNELVMNNMGLVYSIVQRFLNRGYDRDDLVQIGSIGLIRASERFDSSFGVKFSTYAVPMIIGEIKRFMRDDGIIKVSRSLKEISTKAKAVMEQTEKETGKEASVSEIADILGITPSELAAALESGLPPRSIYTSNDDGNSEGVPLVERLESDKDDVDEAVNRLTLKQIMGELKERDLQIVHMRYFEMKTQMQTAEKLGISQVQVSRLEKKILSEMRKKLNR